MFATKLQFLNQLWRHALEPLVLEFIVRDRFFTELEARRQVPQPQISGWPVNSARHRQSVANPARMGPVSVRQNKSVEGGIVGHDKGLGPIAPSAIRRDCLRPHNGKGLPIAFSNRKHECLELFVADVVNVLQLFEVVFPTKSALKI